MTMYRDKAPGQDHEPEYVNDAPDDARGYNQPAWTAIRLVLGLVALVMLVSFLLWLGEAFGLMAAGLPGGLGARGGAVWGGVGVLGLALLLWVLFGARQSGRKRG